MIRITLNSVVQPVSESCFPVTPVCISRRFQVAAVVLKLVVLCLLLIGKVTALAESTESPHAIDVWYGQKQRFGHLGEPQRWINVLGNVANSSKLRSVTMSLNGAAPKPLTIGSDKHRLANAGDFNAELAWDDLSSERNHLQINATWNDGTIKRSDVELKVRRKNRWPLPYAVDFRNVEHLQDVVQVVDGKWRLTSDGVRTSQPYYDRVLSMGDESWENYEATIHFTLNDFEPPAPGPPTYDVTHVGVALRWRGHTVDKRQPSRRWYPLGAQGEFLIKPDLSQCQWRILPSQKERTYAKARQAIERNRQYVTKAQVATIASGDTRYRFKCWAADQPEPLAWDVEQIEKGTEDYTSGSLCLVPHNTDVTYHEIKIEPLLTSGNAKKGRSDQSVVRPSVSANTGEFFRVEKGKDGKWQLLGPQGKPFFLRGLNHYSDGSHMPWARKAVGDQKQWRTSLRDRVRHWGFNYLPPSIGPTAIDPELVREDENARLVMRTKEWPPKHYAQLDFPFTIFLEYPKQYMAGKGMPDVFSEAFRDAVDARCKEVCLPLRDNPNLIGYHFCHNPPWHPRTKSFDQWIEDATKPGSAGRKAWVQLMRQIYGSVERWRKTYGIPVNSWEEVEKLDRPLRGYISQRRHLKDRGAFMARICEEWYQVYRDSIRRYDKNHLILGDRNTLHLQPLPEYAIRIMSRHVDVLSVNVMGPPDIVYEVLEDATRYWEGPIHLADTGAGVYQPPTAKAGFTSRDINEFEKVYAGLMRMGVEHPQIIGFGWCGFYETPPPSNRSGLVDVRTGQPLPARLEIMTRWNSWMKSQGYD